MMITDYSPKRSRLDVSISDMTMEQLKPMLCGKAYGDVLVCLDCPTGCQYGHRAIELIDETTKKKTKPMNKKQICDATKRIEAMENYLEVMKAKDPVAFVMEKYKIDKKNYAKHKIYQWRHNYGQNLAQVSDKILEIRREIEAAKSQMTKESSEEKKPEFHVDINGEVQEEKKPTKRQEEKISQNHLETMRHDLENECIALDKEIEEHKKAITECENRIQEIAEKINAIRSVLDIFKEKDKKYV